MDDPVPYLFQLGEIDDTGNFIGSEHPLHSCLEKFDCDVSGKSPPDVISGKYFDPLLVLLRVSVRILLELLP
jgi:hypothetical protein